MLTAYDPNLRATTILDDTGKVRGINHLRHLRPRLFRTADPDRFIN